MSTDYWSTFQGSLRLNNAAKALFSRISLNIASFSNANLIESIGGLNELINKIESINLSDYFGFITNWTKVISKKTVLLEAFSLKELITTYLVVAKFDYEDIVFNRAFCLAFKNKLSKAILPTLSFQEIIDVIEILNKFVANNKIPLDNQIFIKSDDEILVSLLEEFITRINDVGFNDQQYYISDFIDFVIMNKLLKSWEALYFDKLNTLKSQILVNNFALLSRTKIQTGKNYQKPLRKFYKKAINEAVTKLVDFKPSDLIKIIESIIHILDINDAPTRILVKEFIKHSIDSIKITVNTLSNQDKTKIIWLLGRLGYQDNDFITLLINEDFISDLPKLSLSELTSLVIGFSKTSNLSTELLSKLSIIIKNKLDQFNSKQLINSAQSFAHIYIVSSLSDEGDVYSLLCELSRKINKISSKFFDPPMMNQILQVYYSLKIEDRDNLKSLEPIFPHWYEVLGARDKDDNGSKFQAELHNLLSSKLTLEKEVLVQEIASNVDAYEAQYKIIFQMDGPIHCYINDENEYNVATIFNTMILEKYGYQVIRISHYMVDSYAKSLLPEDELVGLSELTLAQMAAKRQVQEAILAYVANLLPASFVEAKVSSVSELLLIDNGEQEASENIYLSPSDQFAAGNLIGKCIISPFLSWLGSSMDNQASSKDIFYYYNSMPASIAMSSVSSLLFQSIEYLAPESSLASKLIAGKFIIDSTVSAVSGNFQDTILSHGYSLDLGKYVVISFASFAINIKYLHSPHYRQGYLIDGIIVSVFSKTLEITGKALYKIGSLIYDATVSEPIREIKAHNHLRGVDSLKHQEPLFLPKKINDENNPSLANFRVDDVDYAGLLTKEFEALEIYLT